MSRVTNLTKYHLFLWEMTRRKSVLKQWPYDDEDKIMGFLWSVLIHIETIHNNVCFGDCSVAILVSSCQTHFYVHTVQFPITILFTEVTQICISNLSLSSHADALNYLFRFCDICVPKYDKDEFSVVCGALYTVLNR